MTLPTATAFEGIWGLVLLAVGILLPRLYLRASRPSALSALDPTKLSLAYVAAICGSLSLVAVAPLMGVWSWVYAVPVAGALQLMQSQANYEYVFGALVSWLFATYFVAPIAAWLASISRLSAPLLVIASSCGALVLGGVAALAWPKPMQAVAFTSASCLALGLASSLAFAATLRLPLSPSPSAPSAA